MKTLSKIFDYFSGSLMWIASILCILVMLGVCADVVCRYFLKSPILVMDDVAQIIILYVVFLGSAWVLKTKGFINMDIVLHIMGPRSQAWLNLVTSCIAALISLGLFWYGIEVMIDVFRRGTVEATNLGINMGYVILPIPLGSLFLAVQFFRKAYGYWGKLKTTTPKVIQPKEIVTDKA